MIGQFGRRSETERGLVFEEGLIIQRKLKIQSKPLGKLSGAIWLRIMSGIKTTCAQQLAAFLAICCLERINSVKQIYRNVTYNQLVSLTKEATFSNCGNILTAFSTTL